MELADLHFSCPRHFCEPVVSNRMLSLKGTRWVVTAEVKFIVPVVSLVGSRVSEVYEHGKITKLRPGGFSGAHCNGWVLK